MYRLDLFIYYYYRVFLYPQVVKKPGVTNYVKNLKSNRWSGYMSGSLGAAKSSRQKEQH